MPTTEEIVKTAVAALEDIKAHDITVIDTSRKSPLFECVIIASANTTRQTKALADNVTTRLKEIGCEALSTEGEQSGEWVLVDLGSVVVHIMQPAVRAYYNLEELWNMKQIPRAA